MHVGTLSQPFTSIVFYSFEELAKSTALHFSCQFIKKNQYEYAQFEYGDFLENCLVDVFKCFVKTTSEIKISWSTEFKIFFK